jgi:hypothetical protein
MKRGGLVQRGNHHHFIEFTLFPPLHSFKIVHFGVKQQSLAH